MSGCGHSPCSVKARATVCPSHSGLRRWLSQKAGCQLTASRFWAWLGGATGPLPADSIPVPQSSTTRPQRASTQRWSGSAPGTTTWKWLAARLFAPRSRYGCPTSSRSWPGLSGLRTDRPASQVCSATKQPLIGSKARTELVARARQTAVTRAARIGDSRRGESNLHGLAPGPRGRWGHRLGRYGITTAK